MSKLGKECGRGAYPSHIPFSDHPTSNSSFDTIVNILADRIPKDPAVWRKFARYFRMDVDFIRTGQVMSGTVIRTSPS
jgi:hypothetical protein